MEKENSKSNRYRKGMIFSAIGMVSFAILIVLDLTGDSPYKIGDLAFHTFLFLAGAYGFYFCRKMIKKGER